MLKLYFALESTVQAVVNKDIFHLRDKIRVAYERVPVDRVEQFQTWREND
jgi:hypothetical protein